VAHMVGQMLGREWRWSGPPRRGLRVMARRGAVSLRLFDAGCPSEGHVLQKKPRGLPGPASSEYGTETGEEGCVRDERGNQG
jgi:hypothetical protein